MSYSMTHTVLDFYTSKIDPAFLLRKQKLVELCTDLNNLFSTAQGLNLIPSMIDCMYLLSRHNSYNSY